MNNEVGGECEGAITLAVAAPFCFSPISQRWSRNARRLAKASRALLCDAGTCGAHDKTGVKERAAGHAARPKAAAIVGQRYQTARAEHGSNVTGDLK